jgi:hypothetical protein
LVAVALTGALAGCRSSTDTTTTTTTTRTRTIVATLTPTHAPSTGGFKPAPATTVTPLPPSSAPLPDEVERPCPYIASSPTSAQESGTDLADAEGDHVYRTTVLTTLRPVGCRFYFYAPPYEAIADILPRTFATSEAAYDAMVLTARAGRNQATERDFAPEATGIRYQTNFFGPDGLNDWAFVYAKGRLMVIVHTQQTNASQNAVNIARLVVGKINS